MCDCGKEGCPYPNFDEAYVWQMEGPERTKHLMKLVKAGLYGEALVIEKVIVQAKADQKAKRDGATEPRQMKLERLENELKKRGLSTDGLKLVLVERLTNAIAEEKKAAEVAKKKERREKRKEVDKQRSAERRKKILAQREQRKQLAEAMKSGGLAKFMALKAQIMKQEEEIAEAAVRPDIPVHDVEGRIAASRLKGKAREDFIAQVKKEAEEWHANKRREEREARETAQYCAFVSFKAVATAREAIEAAENTILQEQTFFHVEFNKVDLHVTNVQLQEPARCFVMIGYGSGEGAVDVRTEISVETDRPLFTRSKFSITLQGKIARFMDPTITLGVLEGMKRREALKPSAQTQATAPDDSFVFALFKTERIKSNRGSFKFKPKLIGTSVLPLADAVERLKSGGYYFKEIVFHDPMSVSIKTKKKKYQPKEVARAFTFVCVKNLAPTQNEFAEIEDGTLGHPQRRDMMWRESDVMEDGLQQKLGWFESCRRYAASPNLLLSLDAHDAPVYDMQVMPTKRPLTGLASKGTFEIITAGGDHVLKRWNMDERRLIRKYEIQGFDEKHNKQEKTEWEDQNLIRQITNFVDPIPGHTAPVLTCSLQLLPQEKRKAVKEKRARARARREQNIRDQKKRQLEQKNFEAEEKKRRYEARKKREREYAAFIAAAKERAAAEVKRPKTTSVSGTNVEDKTKDRPFTTGSPGKNSVEERKDLPKGWTDDYIPILAEFLNNPMLTSMKDLHLLKKGMPDGIKPRGYDVELATQFVEKFIPRVRKRMKAARMSTRLGAVQKHLYALRRGAVLSKGELVDLRALKKKLDQEEKRAKALADAESEFKAKADAELKKEEEEARARTAEREKAMHSQKRRKKKKKKKKKKRRRKKSEGGASTTEGGGETTEGGGETTEGGISASEVTAGETTMDDTGGETTEGEKKIESEREDDTVIKVEKNQKNLQDEIKKIEKNKIESKKTKKMEKRPKSALRQKGQTSKKRPRSVRFQDSVIIEDNMKRASFSDPGQNFHDEPDLMSDPDDRRTFSDIEKDEKSAKTTDTKQFSKVREKRPGTAPNITHSLVPGLPVAYVKRAKTSRMKLKKFQDMGGEIDAKIDSALNHQKFRDCWWPDSDEESDDLDDLCRVVSGSSDRTAKIWGASSGKVKTTLQEHSGIITYTTCSSDGRLIATCSEDGKICLWDGTSDDALLLHTFSGHKDTVLACSFSPDDRFLLTGGGYLDPTLKLWDVQAGIDGTRELKRSTATFDGVEETKVKRPTSRRQLGGKLMTVEEEKEEERREAKRMEKVQAMMAPVHNLYWSYQLRLDSEFPGRSICQAVDPVPPWWDSGAEKPEWLKGSTQMKEYAKTYAANKAHAHGLERFSPPVMPFPEPDPISDPQFDPILREKMERLEKERKAKEIADKKEREARELKELENLRIYGNRAGDPNASSDGSGTTYYSYSEEELTSEQERQILAEWDEKDRILKEEKRAARRKAREKYMWWIPKEEEEKEEEGVKRLKDYTPSELRKMTKEEVDKIKADEAAEIAKIKEQFLKRKRKARRKIEKMLEEQDALQFLPPKNEKRSGLLSKTVETRMFKNAKAMFTSTSGEDSNLDSLFPGRNKGAKTTGEVAFAVPAVETKTAAEQEAERNTTGGVEDNYGYIPPGGEKKQKAPKMQVQSEENGDKEENKETPEEKEAARRAAAEAKLAKEKDRRRRMRKGEVVSSSSEEPEPEGDPDGLQPGMPIVAAEGGFPLTWCGCVAQKNGYCSLIEHQLQGRAEKEAEVRCWYVKRAMMDDLKEGKKTKEREEVDAKIALIKAAWDAREKVKHRRHKEYREPFNRDAAEELIVERRLKRATVAARVQAREEVMALRKYDLERYDPFDPKFSGLLRIFEGKIENVMPCAHTNAVNAVCFSKNGIYCASASEDKTLKLWDPSTGLLIRSMNGHEGPIQYCEFAPDSRAIVTCGSDMSIRIWDALAGEQIQVLYGHKDVIFRARFMPDTRSVVSCSYDGTVKLWRVSPEPPSAPTDLKFTEVMTDEVNHRSECRLSWKKAKGNGAKVISYHILRRKVKKVNANDELISTKGGLFGENVTVRGTKGYKSVVPNTLRIDHLTPGATYQFCVAAETVIGIGEYSKPGMYRMPSAVPATILKPKSVANTMTSVTIRWVEPDCEYFHFLKNHIYC
eukprot:g2317.t1